MPDPHFFDFDLDRGIREQVVKKLESLPLLPLEKGVGPNESGIYALYFKGNRWLRVLSMLGGVAMLWLGGSALRAAFYGEDFEGYVLLIALALIVTTSPPSPMKIVSSVRKSLISRASRKG